MMRRVRLMLLLGALPALACEIAEPPTPQGNNVCEEPDVEVVLPTALAETSGVAASRTYPGVFWTHNDSGGGAFVFATDSTGAIRGGVRVAEATNRDWEDIALAPCEPGADEHCLFIAEIGDNSEQHANVAVYRIPEPDPAADTVSEPAEIFRFTYPEGARDAESLFITPAGMHVVSKGRSGAVELFRLPPPYTAGITATVESVQRLAPPPTSLSAQATAAASDPVTGRVVLRSYTGLRFFEFEADTLRPIGRPADVVAPDQRQGEGVDFIPGDRLVLTGEARGPRSATLVLLRCDPTRPPADSIADR